MVLLLLGLLLTEKPNFEHLYNHENGLKPPYGHSN